MSTLWIREYQSLGGAAGAGAPQVPQEPGIDQTPLTFSTSVASAAFAAGTRYIRAISDADFHYVIGTSPSATTGALKVPAGVWLDIGVEAGQKIAAINAA